MAEGLHEECGIVGIYDLDENCVRDAYYSMIALQHRGQESCGIAVNKNRNITYYKDLGLVNEVFNNERLEKMKGSMAVGHVRYSTTGESIRENSQPLVLHYLKGNLAIAHNGNLINSAELRHEFNQSGAIYQTTSDTEIIAYAIARERQKCPSVDVAMSSAMKLLKGAYSLVLMSPQKLIAARDPWGFRPLCIGRRGESIIFASESCAFDAIGATYERELDPGEIVVCEKGQLRSIRDNCGLDSRMCIFEYIYFARPDSIIAGQEVHVSRKLAGALLAKEHPVEADLVIGVPDSGISAAMGYSKESGIPYEDGFIKNRYVGRTFIKPEQADRELGVRLKLNPIRSAIKGKRIVMVDDSIVRGTTMARIIKQLRIAGAVQVHVRVSSPPFLWPCYYGTDINDKEQLIANHHTVKETAELVNADSLGYLPMEKLHEIVPDARCGFCDACFSGQYAVK